MPRSLKPHNFPCPVQGCKFLATGSRGLSLSPVNTTEACSFVRWRAYAVNWGNFGCWVCREGDAWDGPTSLLCSIHLQKPPMRLCYRSSSLFPKKETLAGERLLFWKSPFLECLLFGLHLGFDDPPQIAIPKTYQATTMPLFNNPSITFMSRIMSHVSFDTHLLAYERCCATCGANRWVSLQPCLQF
jgi:hypothetical protein